MKLNDVRPNIETSGDLEEQFFSIQDQGMIFDILRNKMYSNPILAICREISCNARDAHREVGTPEVPVHIHLPNHLEPFYKIKDFGPGISPDRMSNIFIKYTASTKRNDNIQTGGFGLGAKTPFSYSDTFTILTNFNGVQYNYTCFIDETKVGKLALLSETPTEEANGTEIIIPVKPVDFRAFADWTEHATRHWDVRPIIKGNTIIYNEPKKLLEGDKWAITDSNGQYNRNARMVIDGIEYPLEIETLRKYADGKLFDAANGNFIMYFGIGELSLSASREQIYLDKQTQEKIRERLDIILKDIKQRVVSKIDSFPNLWLANLYYRHQLTQAFHNLRFLGKLEWKGTELLGDDYLLLDCNVYTFTKGRYSRKHGNDPNKLSRSLSRSIRIVENSALFVNDLSLKEPGARHVKKAFDDDPSLKSLQVICLNDKVTMDFLNKEYSFDQMDPKFLSSITKASGRNRTTSSNRLVLYKFDVGACAFRHVSYASLEEDTNDKVLCLLDKANNRNILLKNGNYFDSDFLKALANKNANVSFYGVDSLTPQDRIEEDFEDFQIIDEYIKEKVIDNKNVDFILTKYSSQHHYPRGSSMSDLERIVSQVTNPSSDFLKYVELQKKIIDIHIKNNLLLLIYEAACGQISEEDVKTYIKNNPDLNLDAAYRKYEKKYPLLSHIGYYRHDVVPHIVHYINLIDKS